MSDPPEATTTNDGGWSGRYLEDFRVGAHYRHRTGRTISEADNTWFTLLTMNTNQMHFNAEYAARSEFRRPLVVSTLTVAIALVWAWIYHPELGLLNFGLDLVGIDGPRWLQSTTWAMPAVVIMSNWKGIGYAMLIFLAGLQAIPQDLLEAATVDGASWFQRLRHIVVPLLAPTTFFILVTSFIGAMQAFDQFYVMTQGGPAYSTTTLVMYVFQNGFQWFQMGYAATIAVLLFASIFAITALQWRFGQAWVFGNEGAQ